MNARLSYQEWQVCVNVHLLVVIFVCECDCPVGRRRSTEAGCTTPSVERTACKTVQAKTEAEEARGEQTNPAGTIGNQWCTWIPKTLAGRWLCGRISKW